MQLEGTLISDIVVKLTSLSQAMAWCAAGTRGGQIILNYTKLACLQNFQKYKYHMNIIEYHGIQYRKTIAHHGTKPLVFSCHPRRS